YEKLIVDYGLTQDEVARRVGKGRTTIANMLRLLRLPPEVQQWISETKLSTGHAKALLALSELGTVVEAARKIIQGGLSVRQAEALVSRYANGPEEDKKQEKDSVSTDPNVTAAIHTL